MVVPHQLLTPRNAARLFVPAALLVLFAGMAVAANVYYSTHHFKPAAMVLSEFENRDDNPAGYVYAAVGTALACALLFPAALVLRNSLRGFWSGSGTWVYAAGCAAGTLMAALEPFLEILHPIHILLAFTTFIGLVGGLGCVSVAAARARLRPGRRVWAVAAAIHFTAILLLLELVPVPKWQPPGFWNSLAASELFLVLLIGAGTAGLAEACAAPVDSAMATSAHRGQR
jgi:hypothetical protein